MRALRTSIIVLVVLAVLFVVADRVAVKLADDQAADKIKNSQSLGTTGKTSVDIKGFPFLTQVAANDLDRVDARLGSLRAGTGGSRLNVTRIDARLRHVHFRDGYSSATADTATGTALVPYKDLTKAAQPGVSVGWGGKSSQGKGRVKVTGSVQILGHTFKRSVYSTVGVSGGDTVGLHADKVPGAGIPGIEAAIRKRTDFARKISGLPSGLKLERVEATRRGVELSISGTDVPLTG